jgi:hypothetical protein
VSDLGTVFTNSDGDKVRFSFQDKKFHIVRSSNGQVKSHDKFPVSAAREMAYNILGLTGELEEKHGRTEAVQEALKSEDVGVEERKNVIETALSGYSERKKKDVKKVLNNDNAVVFIADSKDWEKTTEDLLAFVYENIGREWFSNKRFRELYNDHYDNNTARYALKDLRKKNFIEREKLGDDHDFPAYSRYKYRLSDTAIKAMQYEGFRSEDNPMYRYKRMQVEN